MTNEQLETLKTCYKFLFLSTSTFQISRFVVMIFNYEGMGRLIFGTFQVHKIIFFSSESIILFRARSGSCRCYDAAMYGISIPVEKLDSKMHTYPFAFSRWPKETGECQSRYSARNYREGNRLKQQKDALIVVKWNDEATELSLQIRRIVRRNDFFLGTEIRQCNQN